GVRDAHLELVGGPERREPVEALPGRLELSAPREHGRDGGMDGEVPDRLVLDGEPLDLPGACDRLVPAPALDEGLDARGEELGLVVADAGAPGELQASGDEPLGVGPVVTAGGE